MKKIVFVLSFLFFISTFAVNAQGLLDSLDIMVNQPKTTEYTESTFKAPRLLNGHSVELIGKNELAALISHRFGPFSEGAYNFFGLTESMIRLGLEYGLSKRINLGFGVGSYQRTFDGILKIKLLRQSSGEQNMPVTIVYTATAFFSNEKWTDTDRENLLSSRLFYSHQLLIARKFGNRISLQLSPGMVHRNIVERKIDQNNVFSVAMGGRFKLSKRFAFNTEYYYLLPGQTADDFENAFSVGLDVETGGHVFQLLFTNAISPQEKVFIPENTHKWNNGNIHFGFNIIRVFGFSRKNKN